MRATPDPAAGPATNARGSWPLILAAAVLVAGTGFGVRGILQRTGGVFVYPLDDAYIHMAMGRSLADYGVWGCTPYRFASASSSPLWTVVLAVVDVVAGVRDLTPLVVNVACGMALLWLTDRWMRRHGAGVLVRLATLAGAVLVFPMASMALFGMEHVLHGLLTVAFALAAADYLAEPASGGAGDGGVLDGAVLRLAVIGALLAASRYEGAFLVAIVCASCMIAGRRRQGLAIGLVSSIPLVALGLASLLHGSLFLPNSLMLKAGGDSASTASALFKPIGREDLAALHTSPGLLGLTVAAVAALLLQGSRLRRWRQPSVLLPIWLVVAVALHVHFAFSSTFWVYRYDAYLLVFGIVVAGVAASAVASAWPQPARAVAPAAAVAVLALAVGDVRTGLLPVLEVGSARLTQREHYAAAQFVRTYFPGETVVVNDVGAMAYFADANVLDMFGLCDIEPVLERRAAGGYDARDVQRWTAPLHPRIAIVQLSWGWVPPHVPDTWRKVAEVHIEPEGRTLGFYAVADDLKGVDLRADVEEYYRPLAERDGYRILYY